MSRFKLDYIFDHEEEDKIEIGELWAQVLKLKKSKTHKDRYQTEWGDKTALGIFETILRLVEDGENW